MKTIFLSSFHGYISRNILSTDAFRILAERDDLRLVIFIPKGKREFFERHFARPNVFIEEVPFGPPSNASFGSLLAKRIAKFGLNSASTRIERRMKWKNEGKFFYFLSASMLANVLCRSVILRRAMRFLDYRLSPPGRYRAFFERYRPDLVTATDIENERDVEFLHNAKFFGVKSAGMVRSWDNLTLHGLLRILPDTLLVTSPRVRELAIGLNDMPAGRIKVVGIPHYDKYFRGPQITKEKFFAANGLDFNKKTIFWTPISDYYVPQNDIDPFVFQLLGKMDAQVIARFSPSLEVKALENIKPFPNMVIDRPGVRLDGGLELSKEDDDRLMHSIYFSDVVVCGPSTIALDAVFMDKPVVLVGFHPVRGKTPTASADAPEARRTSNGVHPAPRSYLKSVMRRYDYDHFAFAIGSGGVRLARSEEELKRFIDDFIKNPSQDAEGRERLRNAYAGPKDGRSGEKFVEAILCIVRE